MEVNICLKVFDASVSYIQVNELGEIFLITQHFYDKNDIFDSADSMVVPPKDVTDTMALYVLEAGCAFERAIIYPLFFDLGPKKNLLHLEALFSSSGNLLQLYSMVGCY